MSDDYPAWKLHRYEQPFDGGRETDVIYSCSLCDGKNWSREEFAATPDMAVIRVMRSLDEVTGR